MAEVGIVLIKELKYLFIEKVGAYRCCIQQTIISAIL